METWIDKEMTIVNEEIGDSEEFTDIITADQHSLGAKIYLYGVNGIADISKIEMTKLVIPTVILEKEKGEQETSLPQLVFSKINSTKYKIQIARVQNPYFLVFSESFDKGWKVYINQSQDPISEMTATYLSDKIKEGEHQNIFLNQDTFETLKEKPIAEERHYPVNGYANAWLILPEDADGADNYEIVLEYSPQRLLYIGGAISLLTVIGIIFLTLVRKRYEKTKKH